MKLPKNERAAISFVHKVYVCICASLIPNRYPLSIILPSTRAANTMSIDSARYANRRVNGTVVYGTGVYDAPATRAI